MTTRHPGLDGDEPQARYDAGTPAGRYDPAQLSAMSYSNGQTWWAYKCPLDGHEPWRPGYFDAAMHMLRPGDLVAISQMTCEPIQGSLAADLAFGGLAMVHRVRPTVVLARIGGRRDYDHQA